MKVFKGKLRHKLEYLMTLLYFVLASCGLEWHELFGDCI